MDLSFIYVPEIGGFVINESLKLKLRLDTAEYRINNLYSELYDPIYNYNNVKSRIKNIENMLYVIIIFFIMLLIFQIKM